MAKSILNFCLLTTFCFCTTTLAAKVGSIDMDGETASTHRTLQSQYNEGSGDLVLTSATVLLQLVLHIVFKATGSNSLKSEASLPPLSSTTSNDHHRQGARNRRLQSIPSAIYFNGFGLQSNQSGKCMDIYTGGTTDGISPAIKTCNDQLNQKFKFKFQNDPETEDQPSLSDNFQIVAQNSGKCLDLINGAKGNNADVVTNDCLRSPDMSPDNQQFWFVEWWEENDLGSGTGYFSLRSAEDIDMCLTVFEGKVEDGQIINAYSCSESNNQLWKFY